ncbi:MAG: histidine phosphatase family protein [Salibaculum sp.]|uniref:SixA phosphatase family protein n=1 Tax=Salibaculum sp. TaxID=2855480 RepID=UPI002870746F|nr:histidine phosphatase family protein [Salibaculum sp.]MDR9428083.1 histidine phosphatase family protein [Salibaculum sp.]MDR9482420.1 histidine phosphatase family protein [Salibaculum sp.]
MKRRLILIRHAKSSWDDSRAEDHARVLNARGRRSARAIGAWLRDKGYRPDAILSSDSARTTETVDLMQSAWWDLVPVRYLPALYHAPPQILLEALRTATVPRVALVAHNPGLGDFAAAMAAEPPAHPDFHRYPTGATTVMDFDISDWRDAAPGTGHVVDFIVPRDLTD